MATCEKCGTKFTPSATGEVTSTRILCTKCEAERKAEKARAKAASTSGSAAISAGGVATARPAPPPAKPLATRAEHASGVSANSTASARPHAGNNSAHAAVPDARPVPAKRPGSGMAESSRASTSAPAESKPAPASAKASAASAKVAAKSAAANAKKSADDEERRQRLAGHFAEKDANKAAIIGWVIAVVLSAGAGYYAWNVRSKHEDEKHALEAYVTKRTDYLNQLRTLFSTGTEEDAHKLLDLIERTPDLSKDDVIAGEVTGLGAKSKNLLESNAARRDMESRLAAIEASLKNPAALSPESLVELRRQLGEIEPKAESMGADFVARVGAARTTADRTYATRLHEDAVAYAKENQDKPRLALARYAKAEDEVLALFEEAFKGKNKEAKDFFEGIFKDIIKESDALVEFTFTPDVVDKVPLKDILAADEVKRWNPVAVKGFSHRIDNGLLDIVGPDADAAGKAVLAFDDVEKWRDFVIEMDFVIEQGSFDVYMRLGKRADDTVPNFELSAVEKGLVTGKPYKLTASMIASKLMTQIYPEDVQPMIGEATWAKSRKGALGFVIPEGARIKITSLKVRLLR